jgi:hypothetical protein
VVAEDDTVPFVVVIEDRLEEVEKVVFIRMFETSVVFKDEEVLFVSIIKEEFNKLDVTERTSRGTRREKVVEAVEYFDEYFFVRK